MTTDIEPLYDHPAKFSDPILDAVEGELRAHLFGPDHVLLDPFAGVGRVHELADRLGCDSVGVELEAEWAATHERTICGDSTILSALIGPYHGHVDALVTSPAYGNRMADQYLGSDDEKCRACKGTGKRDPEDPERGFCPRCEGSGKAKSKRMGYAVSLGRRCTPGSGAALAWGDKYRSLHARVWDECAKVLAPGGLWMVNVSSFLKTVDGDQVYQPVMEWHLEQIALRARVVRVLAVQTRRMRYGENGEARVPVEHVIVARKASYVPEAGGVRL